jgi:glycosyltransferase involved in cell wall biosynthesis
MELPVVGFAHGALPEIVEDGITGRLVAPGDEPALARSVAELLAAPARRLEMGCRGRQRVAEAFTAGRTAAGFLAALAELAGEEAG